MSSVGTAQILAEKLFGKAKAHALAAQLLNPGSRAIWIETQLPNGRRVGLNPQIPVYVHVRDLPNLNLFEARGSLGNQGNWAVPEEFVWNVLVVLGDARPARFANGVQCVSFFAHEDMPRLRRKGRTSSFGLQKRGWRGR